MRILRPTEGRDFRIGKETHSKWCINTGSMVDLIGPFKQQSCILRVPQVGTRTLISSQPFPSKETMQISGALLLAGATAATALPALKDPPGKKPGWSYEVYYWNITNLRALEIDGGKNPRFHYRELLPSHFTPYSLTTQETSN